MEAWPKRLQAARAERRRGHLDQKGWAASQRASEEAARDALWVESDGLHDTCGYRGGDPERTLQRNISLTLQVARFRADVVPMPCPTKAILRTALYS